MLVWFITEGKGQGTVASQNFVTRPGSQFVQSGTRAVERTVESKLRDVVSVKDFGAVGNGLADDTAAIQAAIDAGNYVFLPPGTYRITSPIIIKDNTGLIGVTAFWKRRTGYFYSSSEHSVIKYDGPTGPLTCVVRVSAPAVGTVGSDFGAPTTDDLINVRLQNVHVDANGKAQYGWYMYRCGNQDGIGNLTAENAVDSGFLMLGLFAASFGTFGSYSNQNNGFVIGKDVFNWKGADASTEEFMCFDLKANLIAANNGTSNSYDPVTNDEAGTGAWVQLGRGSKVLFDCERNYGRACVLSSAPGGGPSDFIFNYLEANGSGPKILYYEYSNGMRVGNGYCKARSTGPAYDPTNKHGIDIVAYNSSDVITTNEGPLNKQFFLVIERSIGYFPGDSDIYINSNTVKYFVRDSSEFVNYTNKYPSIEGKMMCNGLFKADATLSDTRYLQPTGSTSITRTAVGRYRIAFTVPASDAQYSVSLNMLGSATVLPVIWSKSTTALEIATYTVASPTTLSDTGQFIDFCIFSL